jgi:hypothetical protein
MSETVTLELPGELAQQARALAAATNRPLEDAVVDWIGRTVANPPLESLSDARLLDLCDAALDSAQQEELSDLLAGMREGQLSETEQSRLEQLMAVYRRGLVLKAKALKEAVDRGLRPRLDGHAA